MPFELDRRTRRDADNRYITPSTFFAQDFPQLAAVHGHLVATAIKELDAPPLTVEVGEEGWTIMRAGDTVEVCRHTEDAALVVTLSPEQFSDWAQNQMTLNGFLVARSLSFRGGSVQDVSVWDSLWIALLEGWRVTADDLTFVDRRGTPLDFSTAFMPDDDPADIAHFLREVGYLRLKGWLDPADMAAISADMDRVLLLHTEGDGKSWWATLKDGSRVCVRLQGFVEHSPTTARVLSSDFRRWSSRARKRPATRRARSRHLPSDDASVMLAARKRSKVGYRFANDSPSWETCCSCCRGAESAATLVKTRLGVPH